MKNIFLGVDRHDGFSRLEVMTALTIGLIFLGGLTFIFVHSSNANRELQKTFQQIENGRHAIDIIVQDLRTAGFYGHWHRLPAASAQPDPCETESTENLYRALAFPVQGYRAVKITAAADVSSGSCGKNLLTSANLKPGSDVLVIRRASTTALTASDTALENELYLQATATRAALRIGSGTVLGADNQRNNGSSGPSLPDFVLHDGSTPAPIRKLIVHIYFVAPCNSGSGANGVCRAGDDAIPTLKRLELIRDPDDGVRKMKLVPLVAGIEYLKLEYGVDELPRQISQATGQRGDATVDVYATVPADWTNIIAAKIHLLARNTEPTTGYIDAQNHLLGLTAVPAFNDSFKRQVFTMTTRLMNPAERRVIP